MSTSSLDNNIVLAKGDSGATSHYIRIEDTERCLDNIRPYQGSSVMLPDAGTITPTLKGQLRLSKELSSQALRATALPALKSSSLISLGQLCDDDCTVILNKKKLLAVKNDKIILEGHRNYLDGLWDIPIQKTRLQQDNYINPAHHGLQYDKKSTISNHIFTIEIKK